MVGVDVPFELAAVAAAIAIALYFLATNQMVEPFAQSLADNVPLIGQALAGALTSIVNGTRAKAEQWADAGVTPVGRALGAVPVAMSQLGIILIALLTALVNAVQGATTTATTTAVGAVTSTIGAAVATLTGKVDTLIDLLVPALQANINYIGAEGLRLYQEAGAATAAAIDGLRSEFDQRLAAMGASIDGIATQVEARVLQQVRGIEAGILDSAQRLIDALRGEVLGRVANVEGRVGSVEGELARELPGINTQIGTIAGQIAAVETLTGTIARTLTDEITNCIDPLCDNIKPEIPNIRAALEILELGILAGMITDAIVEPIPAAHRTDALVAAPVDAVISTLLTPIRAA